MHHASINATLAQQHRSRLEAEAETHRRAGHTRLARRARRATTGTTPCIEVTHPRRAGLRLVLTGRAA
jgi:hypothetical protein